MGKIREFKVGDLVVNFDRLRKPLSSRQREKMRGIYPYYGATCVFDYVNDYLFDGDYILLGEDGTVLNEDGSPVLQRISGKTWVNNHAHVLKNSELIDFDYLYYALKNSNFSSVVTGAVQPKISQSSMNSVSLFIHEDKIEQKKIASILLKLDEKIHQNKKINDNLLQQIMTIFNDSFPNISDGDQFISDYLLPKRGKGLLSKDAIFGPVPVVAGGLEPATYHNQSNTNCPVITISASGANAGYVRLWNQKVWSSDSSYIDSSVTKYVYFWFSLLKSRQQEIFDSQTGSAQPHIYPQHIGALKLSKLDIDKVSRFNYDVTPLFELIGRNNDENQYLCEIRDSLLPKLMNGEINLESIEL